MKVKLSGKQQSGFSLIELSVVLVIVTIGVLIALGRGDILFGRSDVQNEVVNVSDLKSKIDEIFSLQRGNYTGLGNATIINSGGIPPLMSVSGTTIRSKWGTVTIAPANSNTQYTITYNTVPQDACSTLVAKTFRTWTLVTIGGTTITNAAQPAGVCGASNTIVWTSN
jgi:prepilin-type N-terminal cleavage/methylation domain-containing protein